jgi:hypothetical protein
MSRKSVWTAGFAVPMVIAVALLSPGLPMVKANAQQASAKSAEVKIDNFSFAPRGVHGGCRNDGYLDKPR